MIDKHYDYPVYWRVADDGAKWKCHSCGERFEYKEVIFTQTPNDVRQTLCYDCTDDDWLKTAKYMGVYK